MNGIFTMNFLGDWINSFFQSVMLWFDSVIYWFAAQCYQLFMKLSMAQIFDNNFYNNFANRIYSILGVFMLFYLAYALLNALVDPEKLAKGDKSVSKLASNLVISLVILGLLPSIFEYAYRLQNYILSSNVIGSLVFGTPTIDVSDDNENSMIRYGDAISFTVLNTFLNSDNYNVRLGDSQKTWFDVKYEILHDGNYGSLTGLAKPIVEGANVVSGKNAGQEVYIDYKVVISTIAGVYLCYIMLSFTLDLGVRVAKLAFCQLVAPIPVIMRAMPGKKGTFDQWLKLTLSIFFEIFVRVAIMYISIYLINGLVESDMWGSFFSGGIQGMLALVIIIMGILTFAKQAPKMLSDVLGINSGSIKLGIGEKLKAGGFFAGGAMLGAGVTGIPRNVIAAGQNIARKGYNTFNAFRRGDIKSGLINAGSTIAGIGTGALSTIVGSTSGMFNAYKNGGKDAKNFGDMVKAAGTGADISWENSKKRANYVASNNGLIGAARAKVIEAAEDVYKWTTGSGFTGGILSKIKFRDDAKKTYDESYKELFETPPYKNMDALLNDYKAKRDAGVTTVDGQNINGLIAQLENTMQQSRYDTIHKNRKAVAYAAYNLAQFAKENYKSAAEADFNLNGIDINDLVLKENDVYRKSTNAALSEAELRQIFEGMDMVGNPILDNNGNPTKGIKAQIKELNDQNKELKQSIEYKELQKREAAKKNK